MEARFETFTVLINRISRNIRKIENHEMADYNLRSTHIACLYHLYSSEKLTSTELCDRCEEDKATISRAISYLEKEGFILCEEKNAKRYKSPLTLTEKGTEAGAKISTKINRVLDEVGAGLTDSQRVDFYRSLNIISENLEKVCNDFNMKG